MNTTKQDPHLRWALGSIPGRDHLRSQRNNQDAATARLGSDHLVLVVADGCGSTPFSEVGARIGAEVTATAVSQALIRSDTKADPKEVLERARRLTLRHLRRIAGAMAGTPPHTAEFRRVVRDHLLFTLVGTYVFRGQVVAFSVGDGLIQVDSRRLELGPFPGNRPPYLAYGLLTEDGPGVKIHVKQPRETVSRLAIGTDGAADLTDLDRWLGDDAIYRNPDLLRRRLKVAQKNGPPGFLSDDTTLAALEVIHQGIEAA